MLPRDLVVNHAGEKRQLLYKLPIGLNQNVPSKIQFARPSVFGVVDGASFDCLGRGGTTRRLLGDVHQFHSLRKQP
jgi:hypothetical protein